MSQQKAAYDKQAWARGKAAARAVLAYYGIDQVEQIKLRDITFDQELKVKQRLIRGAEGRLVRTGPKGVVTVNQAIREPGKKRFVIAHEFGHYKMHQEQALFSCDEAAFMAWHRSRPQEVEANVFAAELLMPEAIFRKAAHGQKVRFETIKALADDFRVTLTAATLRYAMLDIVPCAVIFSKDGKVAWYKCSESFPYQFISVSKTVHPDSGAGEYFSGFRSSKEAELTPCDVWFHDWSLVPGDRCFEQCRYMPRYNAVLSLLFYE